MLKTKEVLSQGVLSKEVGRPKTVNILKMGLDKFINLLLHCLAINSINQMLSPTLEEYKVVDCQ